MLCLEKVSIGSVAEFLQTHTISWRELSQMLQNVSQAIALLHNNCKSKDRNGRQITICHRALHLENILLRQDLSCCVSNFEHSFLSASTFQHSALDFGSNNNDFVKIRYLAPELLDEVLNLNNLENSLKQVDVYALGLIFWEMSRRCRDLYQGSAIPQFELVYAQELGHDIDPSLEQMKILVAKNRARPLFPQVWKDSNPAIRLLKETITEAWDDDGEARLTSSCINERFQELQPLWNKYKLVSQGPPLVDKSWLNNTSPSDNFQRYFG